MRGGKTCVGARLNAQNNCSSLFLSLCLAIKLEGVMKIVSTILVLKKERGALYLAAAYIILGENDDDGV